MRNHYTGIRLGSRKERSIEKEYKKIEVGRRLWAMCEEEGGRGRCMKRKGDEGRV